MRHKTDVRNLQCFGQRMATKNVCFCGSKNAQSFGEAEKIFFDVVKMQNAESILILISLPKLKNKPFLKDSFYAKFANSVSSMSVACVFYVHSIHPPPLSKNLNKFIVFHIAIEIGSRYQRGSKKFRSYVKKE